MANVGLTITEGVNNGVSPFRDASKETLVLPDNLIVVVLLRLPRLHLWKISM